MVHNRTLTDCLLLVLLFSWWCSEINKTDRQQGNAALKKYQLALIQYLSFVDAKESNPKSLKSMEMLSLTSRSFASGPARLILPRYTGTRVCSEVWIRQGQHRASPWKARRHRGGHLTPALHIRTPALEKKIGNSASVLESLYFFTSSGRSTAGHGDPATLVWSPTSPPPSPPTVPVCHRCLRHCGVSGLHRRCSPCTST